MIQRYALVQTTEILERPGEHVNSSHLETKSNTKESKPPKRQRGNQEQKK